MQINYAQINRIFGKPKKEQKTAPKITYQKLFWLFLIGSFVGVLLEGLFCLVRYGHWETHVTSVWGYYNILYGVGAVLFYVATVLLWNKNAIWRFVCIAIAADILELGAGLLLEFGLNMRAWSYLNNFLNFRGHICFSMTLAWGAIGTAFSYVVPYIEKVFAKMQHKAWDIACIILSVIIFIELIFTTICIIRWKLRHFGKQAITAFAKFLDKYYNDNFMKKRFCEWRFLE